MEAISENRWSISASKSTRGAGNLQPSNSILIIELNQSLTLCRRAIILQMSAFAFVLMTGSFIRPIIYRNSFFDYRFLFVNSHNKKTKRNKEVCFQFQFPIILTFLIANTNKKRIKIYNGKFWTIENREVLQWWGDSVGNAQSTCSSKT